MKSHYPARFGYVLALCIGAVACGDSGEPVPLQPLDPLPGDQQPPVQDPNLPPESPGPGDEPPPPDPGGGIDFDTPGPWLVENITYTAAQGILEQPVVGFSTDESQNRWVATHQALYLLRPGEATFRRYAAPDGLHLQTNPAAYCDTRLGGGDRSCPIYGAAADPGITEVVGGGPNEVFVGYAGVDEGTAEWDDPNRHSGKLDRVRLNADGTLTVDRFDLVATGHGAKYWHNRTIQRMVFDHRVHRHELYVGTNHGVTLIRPDQFRLPKPADPATGYPGEWFQIANDEYVSDHLHARVCYIPPDFTPCPASTPDQSEAGQRMGDWRGLALSPDGHLWTAGKWTAGKIRWDASLLTWVNRPGQQAFLWAFGDPYPRAPNSFGFINEPVFRPPHEGAPVHLSGVTVAPDGRVWFSSQSRTATDPDYGVAVWDYKSFRVYDPQSELGMGERKVRDLVALPDGRIAIAGPTTGVVLFDPATGSSRALEGLADNQVQRMELDTMTLPPTLHVSTRTGASAFRLFTP